MPNFEIEESFANNYKLIAGVDEVGRGALIGPVVAAAIIIPNRNDFNIEVNDSKLLKEKTRNEIYHNLINSNCIYAIAEVSAQEIDEINILQATFKAMKLAIEKLNPAPDIILIDGNRFPKYHIPFQTVVKGDSKSNSIASASIIAKVYRDNLMKELSEKIRSEYAIDSNKGYASKAHIEAIMKYGYTEYHRKSFKLKQLENYEFRLFD